MTTPEIGNQNGDEVFNPAMIGNKKTEMTIRVVFSDGTTAMAGSDIEAAQMKKNYEENVN